MNIQLASDLHLEFLQHDWPLERVIAPVPGADVLVLAGDIANGDSACQLFADWPTPVIYVAGNHEFYGHAIDSMRDQMREAALSFGIHFLDNDSVEIGGVRFLGTTQWTDYRFGENWLDPTQDQLMDYAQSNLNDHRLIRLGHRLFTAQDALDCHGFARAWLEAELAKPFKGRTVIVSHHGPHHLSVHPKYANNPLNSAFVSDLSDLMPGADLWLHGHVHDSFDYVVGQCHVVANPAGYLMNRRMAVNRDDFVFENTAFQDSLVVELVP